MTNFTLIDFSQTAVATMALGLFMVAPGFCCLRFSNLFRARESSAAEQVLFSLMLSCAITPVLAVFLARLFSLQVAVAIFLVLDVVAVVLIGQEVVRGEAKGPGEVRWIGWALGIGVGYLLAVMLLTADWQRGQDLLVSFATYDHSVRIPFVQSVLRTGVPPLNPFYGLGDVPRLRYYYYWYVVCALPARLFGLSARACFFSSIVWSGLALFSSIPLFVKHFLGERDALKQKSLLGIAALAVTGLDLIPYLAYVKHIHLWYGEIEWWDPNQVSSWVGSLVWVPHHVAALTACMAGMLMLANAEKEDSLRLRTWSAVLAGVAFASATGLSLYVTFGYALFALLWVAWSFAEGRKRVAVLWCAAGIVAAALSAPFLADLVAPAATAGNVHFAQFALRDFPDMRRFLLGWGVRNEALLQLLQLPTMLGVYVLEFGFFLIVALYRFQWEKRNPEGECTQHRKMAWMLLGVCLVTMSCLRSDATEANDLGIRGMLPAQFVLLIWAGPVLYEELIRSRTGARRGLTLRRGMLLATLLLGFASTLYQAVTWRQYVVWAAYRPIERTEDFLGAKDFGPRSYWLRKGYEELMAKTAKEEVVQYNPVGSELFYAHLYSMRQAAVGDAKCGAAFGGDPAKCPAALQDIAYLYFRPEEVRNWNVDQLCDTYHIRVLVATEMDPIWRDPAGWIWTRPSMLKNPVMRAVRCGSSTP